MCRETYRMGLEGGQQGRGRRVGLTPQVALTFIAWLLLYYGRCVWDSKTFKTQFCLSKCSKKANTYTSKVQGEIIDSVPL